MNAATEAKIIGFVAGHDAHIRAAARLACASILRNKIDEYVDADGWIDWTRLAADLGAGLPWSSGELKLARLGCSLAGVLPDYLPSGRSVAAWSLAAMLDGLDASNLREALASITLAATGVDR